VQFLIGLETAGDDRIETIHRETVDLYETAHNPRFLFATIRRARS
jgi:hypothetical protein